MKNDALDDLQARVDAASGIDERLLREAADALRAVFPDAPAEAQHPFDPTEAALRLVDRCLPGWTIALRGTAAEPDGHWHCTLRESGERDNDAVIGNGEAPTIGLALLRALVCVARVES